MAAKKQTDEPRVVTLHRDEEYDGKTYKAGTQEMPAEVADALIGQEKGFEPDGKKKGR